MSGFRCHDDNRGTDRRRKTKRPVLVAVRLGSGAAGVTRGKEIKKVYGARSDA